MVYQKHSRVTMEVNLHLMKWNPFLKSMVSPILELYCYGALRMGKFSELIALLRKLYKLLLTKTVIGNMNWICFCWPTEILPIVQQVKSRRFSRTVRDKLPTVPGTEDVSGHDDAVKRNRATLVARMTIQISIVAIRQEWIQKIHIQMIGKVIWTVART